MSATRLPREARADYYRTPEWAVRAIAPALFERVPVGGAILDAGAGDGAISVVLANALRDRYPHIVGVELDEKLCHLANAAAGDGLDIGWCVRFDFLTMTPHRGHNAIVMNPPFSQARAFVEQGLRLVEPAGGIVVALLRLGWLAGVSRADFHRAHPADVYVLARRPSFNGKGTDASDYAWFVWDTMAGGEGRVHILGGETP